jgi:hypothetical protein
MSVSAEKNSGDHAPALKKWGPLAEQGAAPAQYNLAMLYYNGEGVPKNYEIAFKWFKLAAQQGLSRAQYSLALMYLQGNDTMKDYTLAHMWLNIVVSQGFEEAKEDRDKVEKLMTPEQLKSARKLFREWIEEHGE